MTPPITPPPRPRSRHRPSADAIRAYAARTEFARRALLLLAVLVVGAACARELTARELVDRVAEKTNVAKSFHFEGSGSLAASSAVGQSLTLDLKVTGDAEPPDRWRGTLRVALSGRTIETDVVGIGADIWQRDPQSRAWSIDPEVSPPGTSVDPLANLKDLALASEVNELERTNVDGKPARHLRLTLDPEKLKSRRLAETPSAAELFERLSTYESEVELWIRVEDERLLRHLVKVTLATPQAKLTLSLDTSLSRFGEPLAEAIAPPR